MKYIFSKLVVLFISVCFISCNHNQEKLFTSLSYRRTGIDFENIIVENEEINVLNYSYLYNGAGVGVGDINNDGLPDIYFSGNFVKSKLYLNKGNFRFEDITEKAGVGGETTWNTGVSMADVNGDGYLDIYVCSSTINRAENRKNLLFLNNGDLTFSESAANYGIDDASYSTHSAFFDYDKDGDLDLFVINHSLDEFAFTNINHKNKRNPIFEHKLYKNTGGKFKEVNEETGMIANIINFGLGLAIADFNNDKWPDIYICNDYSEQDYFYINNKDGTFSEQLDKYFDHVSFSSMGNDAADFNNDGYVDLFTLDMDPEDNFENKIVAGPDNYDKFSILKKSGFYNQSVRNMLQLNNYGNFFTEIGQYANIFATNWSWSSLFCDFDNDGNKDLYITNGYGRNSTNMDYIQFAVTQIMKSREGNAVHIPKMAMIDKIPPTLLKNYIFKNNGDLTFTNYTEIWGSEIPSLSNGAAYSDLDNDGDMDLVISTINDVPLIYRNNATKTNKNHFLKIRLAGTGMNRGGIGARVEVTTLGQTYIQEFMPSRGYMSSMSHDLIFGLGKASNVDMLRIIWPDLSEQILTDISVDQLIILHQEDAYHSTVKSDTMTKPLFSSIKSRNILEFKHYENEYVDFRKHILLPHFLSTQGPRLAKTDVNNDGLDDIFFSGSKDYPGKLYKQKMDGTFEYQEQSCFEIDKCCEDIESLFFDADGDNDPDLYVVSGGNEFTIRSPELEDRLYMNNGEGNFTRTTDHLPKILTSGSCVKAADFDNDGDMDLFVGGRLLPESYPFAAKSYILENNGKGYFKDVTEKYCMPLMNLGMVTDAVWTDFNNDKKMDLIIVGEWMGIKVFTNNCSHFEDISEECGLKNSEGWWNTILEEDFDRDGDTDYIIGNLGLNSRVKASVEEPATIISTDFDNNGSIDAVMSYYINGKSYPVYSKDDLQTQLPFIRKKYPTYESYANQTINDIFSDEEIKKSLVLKANIFSSCYMENKGNNQFKLSPLEREAQFSPIYSIISGDYNEDGNIDLILSGNFYGTRIKFGEYDANKGLLLFGNGKGDFNVIPSRESGLYIRGEVRDIVDIRLASGKNILVFGLNNDSVRLYDYTCNNFKPLVNPE